MKKGKKKKLVKNKKIDKYRKKQVFILTVEPYNIDCIVVCNGQVSDALKLLKRINKSDTGNKVVDIIEKNKDDYKDDFILYTNTGRLYTELDGPYIMIVSHSNNWIKTTGAVSHECNHLSHYVLRNAGIELTKDTEEAYTYLQQDLLEKVIKKMY